MAKHRHSDTTQGKGVIGGNINGALRSFFRRFIMKTETIFSPIFHMIEINEIAQGDNSVIHPKNPNGQFINSGRDDICEYCFNTTSWD